MVVKRSGQRQPFDRAKVVAGVRAAAKNRPVTPEQMEALAAEVEEAMRLEGADVTSQQVGLAVLEHLRTLDEVAYLRFASVYKGFCRRRRLRAGGRPADQVDRAQSASADASTSKQLSPPPTGEGASGRPGGSGLGSRRWARKPRTYGESTCEWGS